MAKPDYSVNYNEFPVCEQCGQKWQLLDFGCALHRLTCPTARISRSEQEHITASAAANGVSIEWK
jgi:hypothetical protein